MPMHQGTVPAAGKQALAAVFRAVVTEAEGPQTAKADAAVAEAVVVVPPVEPEVASVASVADAAVAAVDGDSGAARKELLHQREASHKHDDCAVSLPPSPPLIPPSSSLLMQHADRQVLHSLSKLAPLDLRTR
jgi:hypothetical protein